ncbi:MAG TPA: ribosome recycling factor, partial [Candidatus Aminicenantes bacterium]|nr:ribosome recycling factor [Candidatus Aminicenantes bacterium]
MLKELIEEARSDLKKIEDDYKREVSKFRTGRASVSILDGISIDYYGVRTPIKQLATLGVPEANLIIVQPWDNKILMDIDRAIRNSNIGINPVSDGRVIKLPVPPLDQQRRLEIVKTLKRYTEERRTNMRNIRRDYRDTVKQMKDDKEITEDDEKRFYDDLQKIIDEENEVI